MIEWNVFYYNINANRIELWNIFNHYGFKKYFAQYLKEIDAKEEFAQKIKSELQYYFWARAEYELIIEIIDGRIYLAPFVGCKDSDKVKIDVTDKTGFNWKGFAAKHITGSRYNYEKIDIFDQITYVFNDFVAYCWSFKGY